MATMPKPAEVLADLEVVAKQLEQDKQAGFENRILGRAFEAMATKLDKERDRLATIDVADSDIDELIVLFNEWATKIAPTALATWDRETVSAKVEFLTGLRKMGYLSEDEAATFDVVAEALATTRKGGERGPRTEAPSIEGRPERVHVATVTGQKITEQNGNKANSAANLKARVVEWLKACTPPVVLTKDQEKAILTTIKLVTEGGKDEVPIGDFAVVKVGDFPTPAQPEVAITAPVAAAATA